MDAAPKNAIFGKTTVSLVFFRYFGQCFPVFLFFLYLKTAIMLVILKNIGNPDFETDLLDPD